jgi:hypothetical protein
MPAAIPSDDGDTTTAYKPKTEPEAPAACTAPESEAAARGPSACIIADCEHWTAEWSYENLMALSIRSTADSCLGPAPTSPAAGSAGSASSLADAPASGAPSGPANGGDGGSMVAAADSGPKTAPAFDDVDLGSDDCPEAPLLSEAADSSAPASDGGAAASGARGAASALRKVRRVAFEAIAAKAAALFPARPSRGAGDAVQWAPLLECGDASEPSSAPIRFEPFVLRGTPAPSPARRAQRWFVKRFSACFGADPAVLF